MAGLDTTAFSAVLKVQYPDSKIAKLNYEESPTLSMFKKTKFEGKYLSVPVRSRTSQQRGVDLSVALANVDSNAYQEFVVTRKKDYAVAQIDGEVIDVSGSSEGAVLKALTEAFDGAFITAKRAMASDLFGMGGGARGQISAASNPATPTITLADISQIVNFEVGQVLRTSITNGTSGSQKSGTVTVAAVNRGTGTVTVTGNWTAGIGSAAVNDFIFQDGDFVAANSKMVGIPAWIPAADPSATLFFGVDRSVDPTRLAGTRYLAGAGGAIEDTLTDCAAQLAREGGHATHAVLNPLDLALLIKQISQKVIYDRATSLQTPDIGFECVSLMTVMGKIKIFQDPNCPKGSGWMLNLADWEFAEAKGSAPRILKADGLEMQRHPTLDAYVSRIGYYGNTVCRNTRNQAYFAL